MSNTYLDMLKMEAAEQAMHAELAAECTHPLDQYQPGSPRLEKLYAAMEQAKQTWPLRGYEVKP